MPKLLITFCFVAITPLKIILWASIALGQTGPYDYVQSSSPLGDGRIITRSQFSQSTPNGVQQKTQTTLSGRVAVLPTQYRTALQVPAANVAPSINSQITQPPNVLSPNACSTCGPANGQIYPYPGSNAQVGNFQNGPFASQPPATYGGFTANNGPRPLIKLRNLPPTTYLGQGILGQPTAYVPGEPFRNIFRYIFP
jgi:hypothetical protein